MFHWNKIKHQQEKENSSKAKEEAFADEIVPSTKSQSQGDQATTEYQDKTWCLPDITEMILDNQIRYSDRKFLFWCKYCLLFSLLENTGSIIYRSFLEIH